MSNSCPVIASSFPCNIPKSLAIAFAVTIWSPVIITVFIPALLQALTDSFTPFLGGSIIPINPIKTKLFSILFELISFGKTSTSKYATPSTLSALSAIFPFCFFILSK